MKEIKSIEQHKVIRKGIKFTEVPEATESPYTKRILSRARRLMRLYGYRIDKR